jgi:hypothetical protein
VIDNLGRSKGIHKELSNSGRGQAFTNGSEPLHTSFEARLVPLGGESVSDALNYRDNWSNGTSLTKVNDDYLGVRLGCEPVVEPRFPDSCSNGCGQ